MKLISSQVSGSLGLLVNLSREQLRAVLGQKGALLSTLFRASVAAVEPCSLLSFDRHHMNNMLREWNLNVFLVESFFNSVREVALDRPEIVSVHPHPNQQIDT